MRNVEFKTRLTDLPAVEAALRALGAADSGLLVQRDTYFRVPEGRLKLRETPSGAELIEYLRDERGPLMDSRYTLMAVDDPDRRLAELSARHDVRGVVEKTRHLWLYRNARIHLDHVAGLGSFLEIEVVEPPATLAGQALIDELLGALGLRTDAALRASYIDLIEANAHALVR